MCQALLASPPPVGIEVVTSQVAFCACSGAWEHASPWSAPLALADPLPGAADPAYLAVMDRAMTADDPQTLRDLHDLAVAGNAAALVALPTVEGWMASAVNRQERREHRSMITDG